MKLSKKELKRKISNICDMMYDEYCENFIGQENKESVHTSVYRINFAGDYDIYELYMYGTSKYAYSLQIRVDDKVYAILNSEFFSCSDNTIADAVWRLFYLRFRNVK